MKNLITILMLMLFSTVSAQNLIGKSEKEIREDGFVELEGGMYSYISTALQINLLVEKGYVTVEQYIVYDKEELVELYGIIEDQYYLVDVTEDGMFYISSTTGVTCVVDVNKFTLFFQL